MGKHRRNADQRREDVKHRAVPRRPAPCRRHGPVHRHIDDVPVPGDWMHQSDRIRIEQALQLVPERPETARLNLDDMAAVDRVYNEALDGLFSRAADDGVALPLRTGAVTAR